MPSRYARSRLKSPPGPRPSTVAAHPLPEGFKLAALGVTLVWALLFLPQLFLGQRFVLGDASAFLPFSDYSRTRWAERHERTYWNPYVLLGVESVASLADSRPQYLPDPLLNLTEPLSRPRFAPQLWLLVTHLMGALSVMILATRMLGASAGGAGIAGLGWLLAVTSLLPLSFGHDAQFVADALLPVVALTTHVTMTARSRAGVIAAVTGLACSLGVQVLHGHPQIVVYTALLSAALAAHEARRVGGQRLAVWMAGGALGAALGAALWWPALLYSSLSFRGAGESSLSLEEVRRFSLGIRDLLSLIWPQAVGYGGQTYWGGMTATDYSPYLGAGLVVLACAAVASRVRGALFLATLAGLAVVHALGTTLGPLYSAINQVPLWSKFRVPFYTLIVASFSLSLLAGRGVDVLAGTANAVARRWMMLFGGLALVGIGVAWGPLRGLYISLASSRGTLDENRALEAAMAAGGDLVFRSALVLMLWVVATRSAAGFARWRALLVGFLVALDLGVTTLPALRRATGPVSEVTAPPPLALARVVATQPKFRAYVGVSEPVVDPALGIGEYWETYTNFWISWRARCLTGNHGALPAAWRPVVRRGMTRNAPVLRAWGVGFLNFPPSTPVGSMFTPVAEEPRSRVYALAAAPGRAYAAPSVVALDEPDQVARAMMSSEFAPTRVALTNDPSAAGEYPGSSACSIRWVRDDPEHLVLETESPAAAFVVVADAHSPGWSATLDGHSTPLFATNLLVRGTPVPAGRHRLEMRYQTPGMRVGVASTRAAMGLIALLAGASALLAFRERRAPVGAPPG